jgi:hypothetical protein
MRRFRFILTMAFLIPLPTDLVAGQSPPASTNEKVAFLARMMQDSRQKAKNIQYHAQYTDWDDYSALRDDIARSAPGKAKAALENTLAHLENHNWLYEGQTIVLDDTGRIRIDMEKGLLDSGGKATMGGSPYLCCKWSWDNHRYVDYRYEKATSSGSAILDNKAMPDVTSQRHLWRLCTGTFLQELEETIAAERPVDLEELPGATYRVAFDAPNGRKRVGVVDPAKGFSCTLEETYENGSPIYRCSADYEELAAGVWFPVAAKATMFSNSGVATAASTMRASNVIINDPNFDPGVFHVDLPRGTHVFDRVLQVDYVVGDPSIAGLRDGRSILDLDRPALDADSETEEPSNEVFGDMEKEAQLLVPKVEVAMREQRPLVANLAGRVLIYSPSRPDTEEGLTYLMNLGGGDLAWDGKLLATRGAEILTAKKEANRPLKATKGEWARVYELPRDVKLPYWMVVVTREKVAYLLTVRTIEQEGIRITYRDLAADEIALYAQSPAPEPPQP